MAQVKSPGGPVYPDDVDWKCIDHELMYKLLSLSAEVEDAQGLIDFTTEIAGPPNYSEWFDERAYWYAQFSLSAHLLAFELCKKYGVKQKSYTSWNPVVYLSDKLQVLQVDREKRISNWDDIVKKVLKPV